MPGGPEKRAVVPSDEELALVVAQLARPGALCWAKVATSNSGLALSLSFQPSYAVAPSGSLEIALRKGKVHVSHEISVADWEWDREFLKFAQAQTAVVERTTTRSEAASLAKSTQVEIKPQANLRLKAVAVEFLSRVGFSKGERKDARKEATRGEQIKTSEVVSGVQVYEGPTCFTLLLDARPHDDLVARNSQFNRVEIIELPEPANVNPEDVQLELDLQLGHVADLEHAFRIRSASGFWGQLQEDDNRRIMAELLMSKFLLPLHAKQKIWPIGGGHR